MTIEEAEEEYGELEDFVKDNPDDTISWSGPIGGRGVNLFTFDGKKIYNLFADFPDSLTDEEVRIFCEECPYWVSHFAYMRDAVKARGIIF